MLKGITFADPHFFYLLLIIPVLVAWYVYRLSKTQSDLRLSSTAGFDGLRRSPKLLLHHGLFALRMLALALIIIALARPQSSLRRQDVKIEGIDIVLAVDISGSMLAQDFKPDRLEASKEVATEFIDGRPDDRIGLVVFSGESFTQCPLTTDHAVLKNLFGEIKSGMIEDGTALGDGLATAVSHLRTSTAISKVIILLTDGVSNAGALDPMSAAEIAKMYGIRIYTIGVGSTGMAPYPVQTPFGIQLQMMPTEIDEAILRNVSAMTDGKYFRATNNTNLRNVYHEIDKLEKSKIDVTEFHRKTERFLILALIALGIILIEMVARYLYFRSIP